MTQGIFKFIKYFLAGCLMALGILIPCSLVHAEISITEVAWMGTSTSQYEEWVELYNDGADDVPLTGWKLFKAGGTTLFSLTGTIPAGSYYLACRATASLASPLGGICDEQGVFGGSGLNNTSDQLVLKDASEAIQETIDASGGWPAGETSSKKTMQKSPDGWVTAVATPGVETVMISDEPPPNESSEEVSSGGSSGSSTSTSNVIQKEKIENVAPDPVYEAHMIIPDFSTAGVAVPMKATVKKDKKYDLVRGRFEWSMGDGSSYKFLKNIPLEHIFYYPGTYTVVMQYYSDIFRTDPDTIHRKTITIVPSDIVILGYSYDDGLRLKNESTKEIALDEWILQSNNQEFIFPKYTVISKGSTLALSPRNIGIEISSESIALFNPSRELVTRYSYKYEPLSAHQSTNSTDETEESTPITLTSQKKLESSAPLPQSKTLVDVWKQNKWYVIFGMVVMVSILAYLAFHLYAKQDELI